MKFTSILPPAIFPSILFAKKAFYLQRKHFICFSLWIWSEAISVVEFYKWIKPGTYAFSYATSFHLIEIRLQFSDPDFQWERAVVSWKTCTFSFAIADRYCPTASTLPSATLPIRLNFSYDAFYCIPQAIISDCNLHWKLFLVPVTFLNNRGILILSSSEYVIFNTFIQNVLLSINCSSSHK